MVCDYGALEDIRIRRNEMAHERSKEATLKELDETLAIIQKQLVAWGMARDSPPYRLDAERSAPRFLSDPVYEFEQDHIARVMNGTKLAAELKQTIRYERFRSEPKT